MVDKVPGDISPGIASRESRVHATQADNSLSRSHTEGDISRLQSAINAFNASVDYEIGDLVLQNDLLIRANQAITAGSFNGNQWDNIINVETHKFAHSYNIGDFVLGDGNNGSLNNVLYICKADQNAGNNFSTLNFREINTASLFNQNAGGGDQFQDQEILAYERDGANDQLPETFLAWDLSRSKSAARAYADDEEYLVDDFTLFDNLTYRCITNTPSIGETFDIDKWIPVGGVGVKNVKHVFSQTDFPSSQTVNGTSVIPLEDGIEYIIAAPITLTDPLYIRAGYTVLFRSFATETNAISYTDTTSALFSTGLIDSTFTGATSIDGGNGTRFTGVPAGIVDDLVVGFPVNIKNTGDTYDDAPGIVTAVDTVTEFFETDLDFDSNVSGSFDNGAKILEIERVEFVGVGSTNFSSLLFTDSTESEFFMLHSELESINLGTVISARIVVVNLCEFEDVDIGFSFRDCKSSVLSTNTFSDTPSGAADSLFVIQGSETSVASITQNSFDSAAGHNALAIFIGGPSAIPADARVNVIGNIDNNLTKTTLFESGGNFGNETAVQITALANSRQADSASAGEMVLLTPQTVTINSAGTYEKIASTNWTLTGDSQRFSLDGPVTGILTYNGIPDITVLISYHITMSPNSASNQDLGAGVVHEGSGIAASQVESDAFDTGVKRGLSSNAIRKISNGDEFFLEVRNLTSTDFIDVALAVLNITKIA